MNEFIKNIFKRNNQTEVVSPTPGVVGKFTIGNPTITRNNVCETVWEGNIAIPANVSAIITGTVTRGYTGGGLPGTNGAIMIIETANFALSNVSRTIAYSVNLGNSNVPDLGSNYVLDLVISDGRSLVKQFLRTELLNPNFDTPPC